MRLQVRSVSTRPRPQWPALARAAILLALLLHPAGPCATAGRHPPGIFLQDANVARARALALDAALAKGWHVSERGDAHLVFETLLEEPASPGPADALPPDYTLLRIRAVFIATPAGVNAYLEAEEVWWPGNEREWRDDVTERYRNNLMHALESLQRRWTDFIRGQRSEEAIMTDAAAPPREPAATEPAEPAAPEPRVRVEPAAARRVGPEPATAGRAENPGGAIATDVGTWAYYAEAFAADHGCELSDRGAVLIAVQRTDELHRVHCINGAPLVVRCSRSVCTLER